MRNKLGYLNIDDYIEKKDFYTKGRKEKVWLEKNNVLYLFKTGNSFYESFAEVISSEIAKQCGVEMADYDLAQYKGKLGVVTKSFIKEDDIIVSGDVINEHVTKLMSENNCSFDYYEQHSIESIMFALNLFAVSHLSDNIIENFIKMWVLDGALMESDRNSTNWSLLKNIKTGEYRLAPIYDSSTIARLNNNVDGFINNLRDDYMVYKLTNDIKESLSFDNESDRENFLSQFDRFCEKYPDYAEIAINMINKINITEILDKLETKLSENPSNDESVIPYKLNIWLRKSIGFRIEDMNFIYKKYKKVL